MLARASQMQVHSTFQVYDTRLSRVPTFGARKIRVPMCGLDSAVVARPPSKRKVPGSIPGGSQLFHGYVWFLPMVGCTIKIPVVCREESVTCTRQRVPSGIREVIASETLGCDHLGAAPGCRYSDW